MVLSKLHGLLGLLLLQLLRQLVLRYDILIFIIFSKLSILYLDLFHLCSQDFLIFVDPGNFTLLLVKDCLEFGFHFYLDVTVLFLHSESEVFFLFFEIFYFFVEDFNVQF